METEIASQGQIIDNLINKYVVNYCVLVDIPVNIKRIVIVASGSSYNAALYGKYFFEKITKIKTNLEYASEVAQEDDYCFDNGAFYIFISQSGKSADTLCAIKKVKEQKIKTAVITNNPKSEMYELAQYKFNIEAGEEHAIAATKTLSATIVMLWLISLKIAQNKHIDITDETNNIYSIKSEIDNTINNIENLNIAAKLISKQNGFSIFGKGVDYALSREAALKIRETSYINTSSYPIGEFIHGHFAILNKTNLFLTFVNSKSDKNILSILNKILSTYRTKSIIISDEWDDFECDILIKYPKTQTKIASIISKIIVVQMLALSVAIKLKRNVDKPKGLKKIVDNKDV